MNETFSFPSKLKTISFGLMAIGLVALIAGFVVYKGDDINRVWANLLLNSVFFLGIGMGVVFSIAAHYLGWGGWGIVIKRVKEAFIGWMPIISVVLLLVLIFGHHSLYEWTHEEAKNDPVIAGKLGYLNLPFFFIRFAIFLGVLVACALLLRKASLKEDTLAEGDTSMYKKSLVYASVFIPFFAVYISVSAWDWLMSIDVHWYSTMYGWYSFSSFWVTAIAALTLVVIYVKKRGGLQMVNDNHLHNLGLMMFAFSIFWTYLIFCQFMLIWYANIPEETIYFQQRYESYGTLFYAIFIINFVLPFLLLMSRDAKRNMGRLVLVAWIILVGHFIDFYLMIMPGTVGEKHGFGFLEIGLPCLFTGALIYVVFSQLAKASLVPKNHPLLQESVHHTI